MKLTGKAFRKIMGNTAGKPSFQLEAEINNELTRLQAEGQMPETCIFNPKHNLRITRIFDTFPPKYEVSCVCGYRTIMRDNNHSYKRVK